MMVQVFLKGLVLKSLSANRWLTYFLLNAPLFLCLIALTIEVYVIGHEINIPFGANFFPFPFLLFHLVWTRFLVLEIHKDIVFKFELNLAAFHNFSLFAIYTMAFASFYVIAFPFLPPVPLTSSSGELFIGAYIFLSIQSLVILAAFFSYTASIRFLFKSLQAAENQEVSNWKWDPKLNTAYADLVKPKAFFHLRDRLRLLLIK